MSEGYMIGFAIIMVSLYLANEVANIFRPNPTCLPSCNLLILAKQHANENSMLYQLCANMLAKPQRGKITEKV